jgi:HlyD family secretion protein
MKKRWIAALLFVPLVGAALWWSAARPAQAQSANDARIVAVDRGDVRSVVNASGRISPNFEVDIKCKASGEVLTLPYDISDTVKKDALVLQLDPINEKRLVAQQKANLAAAEWRLSRAQQALEVSEKTLETDTDRAKIALRSAQINAADLRAKANRTKALVEKALVSVEEGESAETAALRAEVAVDEARNALDALKTRPLQIEQNRSEVRLAELAIESVKQDLQDAEQRLKDTSVYAPVDGIVTKRTAQIGTIVSSGITNVGGGTSVMTLCDFSHLYVLATVNEADIGRVRLGQSAAVRCDAFPDRTFEGKVTRISPRGTTTSSVVTFEVKLEIVGEGKQLLLLDMSTDIEIVVAAREKVLRLPSDAVLTREKTKGRYVLLPAAGAASQPAANEPAIPPATGPAPQTLERDVEVGVDDGSFCEIVSGLHEGDKVAIPAESQAAWSKLKLNSGD